MNLAQIPSQRLQNQQISLHNFATPKELVAWMGAMQAQDYPMVKWAMGLRLQNATDESVEAAMDNGDILRTHVLRPTWHVVAAEDIRWMLALTAPNIKRLTKGRLRDLGLTDAVLAKSRKVIEKTLRDTNHCTRDELIAELNKANIATDENRASHIFMSAELEALICSGGTKNRKQTFSLLDAWVPAAKPKSRDEALASLAQRYFASHAPAQLDDFAWWSGLSKTEAARALEMVKSNFISETIAEKTYWFTEFSLKARAKESAYLLPAYDEFTISYKDRSATLTFENHKRVVSVNGIFNPIIVVNGKAFGVWKRTFKKETVAFEPQYFAQPPAFAKKLIDQRFEQYALFLGKKAER